MVNRHKIAIVSASWNVDIVGSCRSSIINTLQSQEQEYDIIDVKVPGSLEIPLMAQKLIEEQNVDCVICIGFVVNGGIYRHEFVAQAVINGIINVQLKTAKPVISAVLTPINFNENNQADVDYFVNHMLTKGKEAALACIEMLKLA